MSPTTLRAAARRLVIAFIALAAAASFPAMSQTTVGQAANVLIGSLAMNTAAGNMVFISLSPYSPSHGYKDSGNPACSTTGPDQWSFVLPLTTTVQLQMYNALLAAHNEGIAVTMVGTGLCDTYANVETLKDLIF